MKHYNCFFHRAATKEEAAALKFGPLVEMLTIKAATKKELKDICLMEAVRRDWRYLADFTREVTNE